MKKFYVKSSKVQGKGCFASRDIKKGEHICFLKGKKIHFEKVKKMYDSGEERVGDPLQVTDTYYLNLEKPYVYFNHSCSPNATIIKKNKLIAIKNINKGEEIYFDYSLTVNDVDWGPEYIDWDMPCRCKSPNCRKVVRPFYKLSKKIKNYYLKNKWVQDLLLKKR